MRQRSARWAAGLTVTALGLGFFYWWGLFTKAGNRRFDEMDGIIPAAAGLLAVVLLVVAAVVVLVSFFRRSP